MTIIVVLNKENLATLHNTDTQWVAAAKILVRSYVQVIN